MSHGETTTTITALRDEDPCGDREVDEEQLKKEIAELEEKIESLEARRPDHDHSGWFAMAMLSLTEELDEKRKALAQTKEE